MPPKRWPANGHGLPSSRSALTNRTPGIDCASRSTATTSSPRAAKSLACRPCPLATSSTGPRATSGAHRATQRDGVSIEACIFLAQQLAQNRAVAARLVLAVATDGEVRMLGKPCEELEQALRRRDFHLACVSFPVAAPARIRPGLRDGPAEQLLAGRKLRKPHVVIVAPRVIAFLHTARRAAHRADAQALAARARATEADDADHRPPPRHGGSSLQTRS